MIAQDTEREAFEAAPRLPSPVPGEGPARRPRRAHRLQLLPYLLLAPAGAFLLLVHFIPMGISLYTSTLRLNQGHVREFLGAPSVGIQNFSYILFDPISPLRTQFLEAARNTVIYTVSVNALALLGGLTAALLITRDFRGRGLARTLLLLPWIVPTYVVGILWGFMWQPDTGIVNHVLHDVLHLPIRPFWLLGPLTMVAIVVPTAWRNFPQMMLMLSAGLAGIPADLYEAAQVDGATSWQRLRYITLPMLRPVMAVVLLFGIISTVYSFNVVFTMFGRGTGYAGDWGDVLPTMIFRNSFGQLNLGVGAAASVMLMLVAVVLVAIWYLSFREDLRAR
ncbi:MAG TPA: sugar ABC transporter permease [Candidatus Dormibacteraeota bacterium]